MVTLPQLRERVQEVRRRIGEAAARAGRSPDEVILVAVTKGWPRAVVELAVEAGLRDIGESYVQEAMEKKASIPAGVRFHMVGYLQRNKARKAATMFDVVHSISSLPQASALDHGCREADRVVDVLVQVNVAQDQAKYGIAPGEVGGLLKALEPLDRLRVVGLMTIGPLVDDPQRCRPWFRRLREIRDELALRWPSLCHLSMGMSADFEVAVEEGATMVRIGTLLFGPRTT